MAWTEAYWIAGGAGAKDGTSEANAWDTAALITAAPGGGTRINMKASTDANTTTARTFSGAGSSTSPVWFRGYKTTPGDMDAAPGSTRVDGTDIPLITFTTAACTFSGVHQTWSNISIQGARTAGAQVVCTGGLLRLHRVRVENTGANSASSALQASASIGYNLTTSWFKASSSASLVLDLQRAGNRVLGCVVTGGGIGIQPGIQSLVCYGTAFVSTGSHGIRVTGTSGDIAIDRCVFSRCGSDAIRIDTNVATNGGIISNCLFSRSGGYDINNNIGSNTNVYTRVNNFTYNSTSGHENGFGDSPVFGLVTELTTDPLTSASDLTTVSGSAALAAGTPQLFENVSFSDVLDIGFQKLISGGSSGGFIIGC